MITVADAFKKFKSRLELTDREQKDASRRHQDVREHLRKQFDVERDFLTGSYARWTKTKPLKDIDIFSVLGEGERHYRDESPSRILEEFRRVLAPEYGEDKVSLGRRSVKVDFGVEVADDSAEDQVISVDVVPSFSSDSHYDIPDLTTGTWIATDPEVHADLATKANKSFSGEWKPLVKMIKKWNETAGSPIGPSFLLEVMALELFAPPFSGDYPYELKGFFATAAERIVDVWEDPAGLGPPVSDQMVSKGIAGAQTALLEAEGNATRALRAVQAGRNGGALRTWRELFGPRFPLS